MTWTCMFCGRTTDASLGVLGVRAHAARPGRTEHWQIVHGLCFERAGLSYGVSFEQIRQTGWQWWVRHVGEKSWAEHTDYEYAFGEVG